jgi:hypothetical protein
VVYPNPAIDDVFVQVGLDESSVITVELIDQVGRTVISDNLGKINTGSVRHMLEVSSLAPGVYFVQVEAVNSSVTRKVIIR